MWPESLLHRRWVAVAGALLTTLAALSGSADAGGTFNVKSYGAGAGDSTGAFMDAFAAACAAGGGTVLVPSGAYTVQPFAVAKCNGITFQVQGTVQAPADKGAWHSWKGLGKGKGWIQFDWMSDLIITGGGTFDGRATLSNWWNDGGGNAPISLSFTHCANLKLTDFTVRNSPGTHIQVDLQMIEGQQGLTASGITIDSNDMSPNTDGIHLSHLWNAVVKDCYIGCGDDCVVTQTDCKNILIQDIHCGPGNGISLGSLGNGDDSCMNNILVQRCTFVGTHNGARIKAWSNRGRGAATGITFRDLTMVNVKQPIVISQCYSGGTAKICTNGGQSVAIYDVVFENIRGTCDGTAPAITISCIDGTGCAGITMRNVALTGGGMVCGNAYGEAINSPGGCLMSGGPSGAARSSGASSAQMCGYGSNGYYSSSGPGAPGSPLRTGGGGSGGGSIPRPKPRPQPRPRPRPKPRGMVVKRGRGRGMKRGGMHGRKGHHPRNRGMRKGKGMHNKKRRKTKH